MVAELITRVPARIRTCGPMVVNGPISTSSSISAWGSTAARCAMRVVIVVCSRLPPVLSEYVRLSNPTLIHLLSAWKRRRTYTSRGKPPFEGDVAASDAGLLHQSLRQFGVQAMSGAESG